MEEKGREPPPVMGAAEPPRSVTSVEGPKRRSGGVKRKALSGLSNSAPSKRLAKERNNPFAFLPPVHSGPVTRARQSPNKLAAAAAKAAAAAIPLLVPAGGAEADGVAEGSGIKSSGDDMRKEGGEMARKEEPIVDLEFEAVRSRGTDVHVVPTHAGWFSWNKVHPLEKQTMASFFNGKSEDRTPDTYVEIRDSIMKKFHADPQTQIEPDHLSDISAGDMDARKDVLEFLDHWGLINFHPFPPNDSDASVPKNDEEEPEILSSIEKLYLFEHVQASSQVDFKVSPVPAVPPRLLPETSLAEDLAEEPSVQYHCNSCAGDCSRKRYHCQKQADFDLCTECYNAKKFGQGMVASDFILMESAEIHRIRGGSWTDQETLLLLEALELFGENWNEIAEHVATKTKAQCFLHFIQMPIEDTFLDGNDNHAVDTIVNSALQSDNSGKEPFKPEVIEAPTDKNIEDGGQPASCEKDISEEKDGNMTKLDEEIHDDAAMDALRAAFNAVGVLPEQEILPPFAEAGNPVMALAVFLSSLVDIGIINMSTQSSLKAIFSESPAIQLATRHCILLDDPLNDNKDQKNINDEVTSNRGNDEKEKEIEIPTGSKEHVEIQDTNVDTAKEEKDLLVSSGECLQKHDSDVKEDTIDDVTLQKKDTTNDANAKEPTESSIPGDQVSVTTAKDSLDLESKEDNAADPTMEAKNSSLESTKDGTQCTRNEFNDLPLEREGENSVMDSKAVTDDDTIATVLSDSCAALKPQPVDSVNAVEVKELAVDEDLKVHSNDAGKSSLGDTDPAMNMKKTKRAAATALSAVAVKAKILAMQEEESIRHLASTVIAKQLQKLEFKMALYNDIESILTRVKEQLDRARKKLYHERTQIIAARFGFPSSSSRLPHPLMPMRFGASQGAFGTKLANVVSQNPSATKP